MRSRRRLRHQTIVFYLVVSLCGGIFLFLAVPGRFITTTTFCRDRQLSTSSGVPEPSVDDGNFFSGNRLWLRVAQHAPPLDRPPSQPYRVPNNALYVWCTGDPGPGRQFQFHNYLSLLSVIHFMQPDNIEFHYNVEPSVDKYKYNTWLTEVERSFPFFHKQQTKSACDGVDSSRPNVTFIRQELARTGGVYVSEEVVLTRSFHRYRTVSDSASINDRGDVNRPLLLTMAGEYMTKLNKLAANSTSGADVDYGKATNADNSFRCVTKEEFDSITSYNVAQLLPLCVLLDQRIHPKDIWELDSELGRTLRTVAYGSSELARPEPDSKELVPNIGHVVWIGGGEMKFDFFLCVLSLLNVALVDVVYIHGQEPSGFYWDLIRTDPRIRIVYRTLGQVYGNTKPAARREHISDICRVDALLRYGGIYADIDAIFVRPLTPELRSYSAVATVDINTAVYTVYPDHISNGVMIGKRNAPFWRLFLESMQSYDPDDYFSIGVRTPYKIKERFPNTLLLEPRLQVLCYMSRCRPTWLPDYQKETVNHLTTGVLKDWKNAAFAFHFTWPTPGELTSHLTLVGASGPIADIGRYVLEKSRMLNYFQELARNSTAILAATVSTSNATAVGS
jgi:hypothetical protein